MPRRRAGPVRINGGHTWFARLTIPQRLRCQAGKTRLIRSLQTTDHSVALSRYSRVYASLEVELEALLRGNPLRVRIDLSHLSEDLSSDDLKELHISPYEQATHVLGVAELEAGNKEHQAVYESIDKRKELPITWSELVQLWKDERSLSKTRSLAANSITNVEQAVKNISGMFEPSTLTKEDVRAWIKDQQTKVSDATILVRFKTLKALINVGINEEKLFYVNPFNKVKFSAAKKPSEGKRPFTLEEMKMLKKEIPEIYLMCLTSLRPSEVASRSPQDVSDSIILIDDQPSIDWRPKTMSSYRRVPLPANRIDEINGFWQTNLSQVKRWQRKLRKLIPDPKATPHSGRHTFITLSRQAGCDSRVIEAITGHASGKDGSQVMQGYGEFKDEVLVREAQKVWDFVDLQLG